MKALTALFSIGVAGIGVCLVMTLYLGVKAHQAKNQPTPVSIPMPAY